MVLLHIRSRLDMQRGGGGEGPIENTTWNVWRVETLISLRCSESSAIIFPDTLKWIKRRGCFWSRSFAWTQIKTERSCSCKNNMYPPHSLIHVLKLSLIVRGSPDIYSTLAAYWSHLSTEKKAHYRLHYVHVYSAPMFTHSHTACVIQAPYSTTVIWIWLPFMNLC